MFFKHEGFAEEQEYRFIFKRQKDTMVQFRAKDGFMLPYIEIPLSEKNLPIEEINSTQNKDARIQSLQPFVKNGYIKFSRKHKTLLKQMLEYPMGKNDDGPDGLQMAVKLALDIKVGRKVDYKTVIARAIGFKNGAY